MPSRAKKRSVKKQTFLGLGVGVVMTGIASYFLPSDSIITKTFLDLVTIVSSTL